MRVLMIAPEPFFQPRGTPFSEYYRARALIELGHRVDMVTYPLGTDVDLPGLGIFRALRLPGVRSVPVGPSWVKIPLDVLLFAAVLRRLASARYDVLDCHEEAGLMGVVLSRLLGIPTIYDMHSSLPEQLANFRFSRSRLLRRLLELAERWAIRGCDAVIAICPQLQEVVARVDPERPCFVIENSPLAEAGQVARPEEAAELRKSLDLEGSLLLLYTGTFEAYQGLDLLFAALQRVTEREPRARLLMVGGDPGQVKEASERACRLGLDGKVCFTGQRPPSEMSVYLAAADILVSPRSSGTNTPLKIYSYLRAGKPIVATRLPTHTQVLDEEVAILAWPEPNAFAEGILTIAADPALGRRLGENARRRAEEEYSYARYLEKTSRVCDFLIRSVEAAAAPGGTPGKPARSRGK